MEKKNLNTNNSNSSNKGNLPNKPGSMLYNTLITIIFVVLINMLLFPGIFERQVITTDYGTFIAKVDSGIVKNVNIEEDQILYIATDTNNKDVIYKTGAMDDPGLTERLLQAKSPNKEGRVSFTKIVPQKNSPIMNFLLMWVLPSIIFFLIANSLFKKIDANRGSGGNFMSFGNDNNIKVYADSESKTTFADVEGQDEAKEGLSEIVDFLHNPSKYAQIGASLPKGVLLVGPPGTGKTLIAKAVAGEAKVPFFSISGSEFVQMFVGMGAARVRDLFKQANEKAPCIVFIDEIDAIGKKRGGAYGGNDEREQTLNQLLTEMDGFDGKKGVVILAATNRPDDLDKALLRPGRFDRRIPLELPDLEGRKAILKVHLKKVKHSDRIDLDLIGRSTAGSSGAELANIINEAALRAVRLGRDQVEQEDLEESVETVIAGHQKKGKVVSQKEREIVAYHEIGHALVAAKQTNSAPVHKITIIPRTSGALGYTMQVDAGEQNLISKEELLNRIATLTGGRAAEEVIFKQITTGASNDIEQATRLARAMITRYGMSKHFDMTALETISNQYLGGDASLTCSAETAADIDKEVIEIIKTAHDKAREIIENNIDMMHALSKVLLEKETITGTEFMEILNKEK